MSLPMLADLEAATAVVYRHFNATPQYSWPLLNARVGTETWVKHENHTPIGAFKVRGGINFMTRLRAEQPCVNGVISATRGNHGQSLGFAARAVGMDCVIVVPEGNNPEKNAAMEALGIELIVHGRDFQDAADYTQGLAVSRGLKFVPPFHPWLVEGVGTYALEFFRAHPDLDVVYVAIGMGSGVCGLISARNALGLKTHIVGVVADTAPAYALSFDATEPVETETADTIADGVACRIPDPAAFDIIMHGCARVIRVTDDEIMSAMRAYFTDTHNLAEGAGAIALAAAVKEKSTLSGKKVGLILSGGNVDAATMGAVLAGAHP